MRRYFDTFGDAERDRLSGDVAGRVSLEVHRRFLARFVRPGDRVLEVGAGPGRFTAELAALGASIVVTDPSRATGAQRGTSARRRGRSFGGAPGGLVVGSVMSLLGVWRHFLPGVVTMAEDIGEDANDLILRTGDLRHKGDQDGHVCRMFRHRDLAALAQAAGGEIVVAAASNWAALGDPGALAALEADPDRWARFLEHEIAACQEPGAVDGGTHILFACTAQNPPVY